MNRPRKKTRASVGVFSIKNARMTKGGFAVLVAMARRGHAWALANPDKQPLVQWNFGPNTLAMIPLTAGFEIHMVTANTEGRALLAAMCAGEDPEPETFMVRIAMQYMEEIVATHPEELVCPACGVAHAALTEAVPIGGTASTSPRDSFIVCGCCAALDYFDASGQLLLATAEQNAALEGTRTGEILRGLQEMIRSRPLPPE